jgi:cytochrome c
MYIKLFLLAFLFLLTACDSEKPHNTLDGKKLLEQKCASCHDLHMPPITSPDEKAPPIMAVSFHVYDFVQAGDESQRKFKAIAFVEDYVKEPSLEKSFCDKASLKRYGLMPSQKEHVNAAELHAIASYMFEHYNQKNLSEAMQTKAKYDALPAGEKVAIRYKCLSCHRVQKDLVGPSFTRIADKFATSQATLTQTIQNGSKGKWSGFKANMPAFKDINDTELEELSEWILKL